MSFTTGPLPNVADEPYAAPFWEAAREHTLLLQYCPRCDRHQFFPRPWCQQCGKEELPWDPSRGTGTVRSFTVVRRAVKNPEFEPDLPYVLVWCDLEEGPRVFSRLIECAPGGARVDMRVEVAFHPLTDELTLPVFRPREG